MTTTTTTTTTPPRTEPGLRERKRIATQQAIEWAAIDLVNRLGYDHVTVDMICEAAMVSPGTFFNYFGSKEGVILGPKPPPLPDEVVAAFVGGEGSHVVADLVTLITAAIAAHDPDIDLSHARRAVILATPGLASREAARMAELEEGLADIVLQRFEAQGRRVETTPDLADEARMVVLLATSVLRFALPNVHPDAASDSFRESLEHATALLHRLIRTGLDA